MSYFVGFMPRLRCVRIHSVPRTVSAIRFLLIVEALM